MTVPDVLDECTHTNCMVLTLIMRGLSITNADFEDVFYPLRHHQDLRLDVEQDGAVHSLKHGAGDFIYPTHVDSETPENSIEPFQVFDALQDGSASIVGVRSAQDGETES